MCGFLKLMCLVPEAVRLGTVMERLRFRTTGEILYEVMAGLLFYPRTLWRVLLWPTETLVPSRDGRDEIGANAQGGQPGDLISPPLFLLISALLAHALDLFLGGESGGRASSGLGALLFERQSSSGQRPCTRRPLTNEPLRDSPSSASVHSSPTRSSRA